MTATPLPASCSIELFETSSVTEQDVLDLWRREGVLDADEAQRRTSEVFMVAVDDGALVGVLTTFLEPMPQLGLDLWVIRALVAGSHRQSNVARSLYLTSWLELESRYVRGEDTRGAGMVGVLQSPALQRHMTTAVAPSGAIYVGDSPRDEPLYLRYFQGATIPDRGQHP